MSIIANSLLQGDDGYKIQRSLRLQSSASAYLSKSYIFGTSANDTSLVKKTYSFWMKRGTLGTDQMILSNYTSAGNLWQIAFDTSDRLYIFQQLASTITLNKATTQVFRDPSSWYHIVIVVDTTLATAEDRFQIWVNNTRVTSWSINTIAAQNANALSYFTYTSGTWTGNIGRRADALYYFDGYLTEFNAIDGQALTPSSFGETDSVTGVWKAKKYSGTYGTNGFYLPFSDNTSTTTLGYDKSGNSNNWTPNNISVTAGVTYDSMTDVPTLTSATQANYCVLNPLNSGTTSAVFNGNLTYYYANTSAWITAGSTIAPISGKWYWEITADNINVPINSVLMIGLAPASYNYGGSNLYTGQRSLDYGYYCGNGLKYNNGTGTTYGATYANGDVIGVAFDADTRTLTFYKNNTSQGVAFSSIPSGEYMPTVSSQSGVANVNFGQRPFAYTPPTGFVALNTFNLPDATIKAGNKHFDVGLYTGTGSASALAVSGVANPDFVWIKARSGAAASHALYDTIRGFTNRLYSNSTNAEFTYGSSILTPTATGFNLTTSDADHNANTNTYAAWQWKAGGSAVSNTAGSITSQVSANTSAGFSVVTFTTPASGNFTVGHGLGVAPSMFILKTRSGVDSWYVYNKNFATPATNYLTLNSTAAVATSASLWGSTNPTSSVLTLGTGGGIAASATGVLYCFSEVAGYSKIFSYTGNGSTDGVFCHLGFRPKYLMVKNATTAGYDWVVWDSSRSTYNVTSNILVANQSSAEATSASFNFDFLSNGFKVRASYAGVNGASDTFVGIAFAENPFKYSLAK